MSLSDWKYFFFLCTEGDSTWQLCDGSIIPTDNDRLIPGLWVVDCLWLIWSGYIHYEQRTVLTRNINIWSFAELNFSSLRNIKRIWPEGGCKSKNMLANQELFKKFARWAKSHGLESSIRTTLAELSDDWGRKPMTTDFLSTKDCKGAVDCCMETTTAYGF